MIKLKDMIDAKNFELKLNDEFDKLKEEDKNWLVGCLQINEDMSLDALRLLARFLHVQISSMTNTQEGQEK